MKTPHSTLYRYEPETIAAANRIPAGCVNEQAHKSGMIQGEPITIILDALLKYAAAYRERYDGPLANDHILGAEWLAAIRATRGLLDGDGAIATRRGIATDSKDNSACETVFWDAIRAAGFAEADFR